MNNFDIRLGALWPDFDRNSELTERTYDLGMDRVSDGGGSISIRRHALAFSRMPMEIFCFGKRWNRARSFVLWTCIAG